MWSKKKQNHHPSTPLGAPKFCVFSGNHRCGSPLPKKKKSFYFRCSPAKNKKSWKNFNKKPRHVGFLTKQNEETTHWSVFVVFLRTNNCLLKGPVVPSKALSATLIPDIPDTIWFQDLKKYNCYFLPAYLKKTAVDEVKKENPFLKKICFRGKLIFLPRFFP